MFGAPLDVTVGDFPRTRTPRWTTLRLLALAFALSAFAPVASAQYCTPDQCDECNLCQCSQRCCHSLPELWLINTRCAPRCKNLDCGFEKLIYKRYDRECCRWVRESRETFLAAESTMPSLFYAHGNSLNHKNAMKGCWQVYCKMRCCAGSKRLVFWSWPAERVYKTKGLRVREMIEKNLKIKYVYAEYQGYYMAKLVNMMSLSQRVMMSGHSYGGITTSSAAHLLGGGCLRGLTLEGGAAVERPNLRAAVISGAFDHDMLIPGNRYGQAFVAAEKIFVTRNYKDRTLKKWPKTSWRCKKAIGVMGVNANHLGVYRNKLCQLTMTEDVGTSHYLKPHLNSVRFVAALCCLSFPECYNCASPATSTPMMDPAVPELAPTSADADLDDMEPAFEGFTDDDLDDESFVDDEEDELALQLSADLSDANLQLAYADDLSLNPTEVEQPAFTSAVSCNRFGGTLLPAAHASRPQPAAADFNAASAAIDWNQATPVMGESLAESEVELQGRADCVTAEAATPTSVVASQPQVAEASGLGVWYQGGFCLAIVLTGQFYVLFSKRVSAA